MKEAFFDSLISKLDKLDPNNMQAFILKLAKQKGFLETIFNAIREGIVVINRELEIVYANKCSVEMLGFPDNVRDQKISTFIRDVDWKKILNQDEDEWYRISRQDVIVYYPVRRVLNFYIVPNEEDHDLATIILSDITEKISREQENIESEKVQLMSILSAGVAHEIGNPLNSLNIHLELLDRKCRKNLSREGKEIVGIAKSEVKRLDLIITQFLSAIRPSKPNMEDVDLREIIFGTIDFMRNELEENAIKIEYDIPEAVSKILGDVNQLKQVFFNLIKNAMQAMPAGGVVKIRCFRDEDNDCLKVSVSDSGCGISSEDMPRIFEPYFTKKNKGTGLGLMIVEKIVREHGAGLSVDSNPGKGTAFTISFPIRSHKIKLLEYAPEQQGRNLEPGD